MGVAEATRLPNSDLIPPSSVMLYAVYQEKVKFTPVYTNQTMSTLLYLFYL